ncbi:CheY-like superfamily protein, partial [Tribonema minus]
VLVVDDEGSIRKFLDRMLEQRGYRVVVACDGVEGLGAMKTCAFHAVLLDLNMPRMGGLEVLAALREWEREQQQQQQQRSAQYVCVTSANCAESVVTQVYESGADYFLAKPIDMATLVRAL